MSALNITKYLECINNYQIISHCVCRSVVVRAEQEINVLAKLVVLNRKIETRLVWTHTVTNYLARILNSNLLSELHYLKQ